MEFKKGFHLPIIESGGDILNPEYYDNKNIIKYLKQNFGAIGSKSDTSIANFKNNIKRKYNKEQLQEIQRKITFRRLIMESSSDTNMINIIYGSLLAGFITSLFTYITIQINQLNFYADKQLSMKLLEDVAKEDKEALIDEIHEVMIEGINDIMSIGMKSLLVFFITIIIVSIVIAIIQTRNKHTRRVYGVVIKECIEELKANEKL